MHEALRRAQVQYQRLESNRVEQEVKLRKTLEDLGHVTRAQEIVQTVAASCQDQAHQQIAQVVTRCLETVFEDAYDFQIVFDRKRGKTEARLVFLRNGQEISPLDASGGGVVDIAALALRLACLVLSKPRRRLFLCLDEPLCHISADYRERVGEMILMLSRELGVQFLIVTHIQELAVGKVIDL